MGVITCDSIRQAVLLLRDTILPTANPVDPNPPTVQVKQTRVVATPWRQEDGLLRADKWEIWLEDSEGFRVKRLRVIELPDPDEWRR